MTSLVKVEDPVYEFGAPSSVLGADQAQTGNETVFTLQHNRGGQPQTSTQGDLGKSVQVPIDASLPRPLPRVTFSVGPTLKTRQLWEGTVREVRDGEFVAILSDRSNPNNPDEQAEFDLREVSEEDRQFVQAGATFYLIIGAQRTAAGQIMNVSIVQFRRLPTWTRGAISRAATRANHIREAFRLDT